MDTKLKLTVDTQPLILFTEVLQGFLKRIERPLDLGNLTFELARIDSDFSTANTGELFVRLYPSDAFLSFAGTIFTGKFDFSTI